MTSSPNRMISIVFGAGYLLIGALGFAVTSGVAFLATHNESLLLWLFAVNPLHNLAHLALGAVLLIAGLSGLRSSTMTNSVVGAVFLLFGIAGLFLLTSTNNVFAINGWDNVLHLASAVVLLGAGLGANEGQRSARPAKS